MEYRASFIMLTFGQFLVTCIEFASIWFLFQRFGGISGWTLPEVGLFYGIINTAFAFADAASRGFDVSPASQFSDARIRWAAPPRSSTSHRSWARCFSPSPSRHGSWACATTSPRGADGPRLTWPRA